MATFSAFDEAIGATFFVAGDKFATSESKNGLFQETSIHHATN
jgi:hypothetical protein